MRSLQDLDTEILATEARLAQRRLDLGRDLSRSRERTRNRLASPGMLLGALAAGFAVERLGRLRPRRGADAAAIQRTGIAGLSAGLGAALVRAALSNPGMWQSLHAAWEHRRARRSGAAPASERTPHPDAAELPSGPRW